jgi:phenylpyruvate tautomerase PptA (4-oxalocrotonate tautomerase family)
MPMIDAYAPAGTFRDRAKLARDLATAVMTIERVPNIPLFRQCRVLLTEAPDGGWGLAGHAHTSAELVAAVRAQLGKK